MKSLDLKQVMALLEASEKCFGSPLGKPHKNITPSIGKRATVKTGKDASVL